MFMCCGGFYCPDKYFNMPYEELPKEIVDLLSVKMLPNKKKTPLYELVGCGESIDYLTFDMNTYADFIKEVKSQYD